MNKTKQLTISKAKKEYKCFTCGKAITFKSKQRLNLDGSVHICERKTSQEGQQARQEYQQQNQNHGYKSRQNKYWSWYWGYGPGQYHKKNYQRYSSQDYEQRREEAKQRYNEYRNKYQNSNLSKEKACEILEIGKEVLTQHFQQAYKTIRAAYAKLALKYHPDRNHAEGARAKFEEATTAFELLTERRV